MCVFLVVLAVALYVFIKRIWLTFVYVQRGSPWWCLRKSHHWTKCLSLFPNENVSLYRKSVSRGLTTWECKLLSDLKPREIGVVFKNCGQTILYHRLGVMPRRRIIVCSCTVTWDRKAPQVFVDARYQRFMINNVASCCWSQHIKQSLR